MFYFITRGLPRGDAQDQIFYFIIGSLQTSVIDIEEKFHDCGCDPFVAVNKGMRLRKMIGIGRRALHDVRAFVMMPVWSGGQS